MSRQCPLTLTLSPPGARGRTSSEAAGEDGGLENDLVGGASRRGVADQVRLDALAELVIERVAGHAAQWRHDDRGDGLARHVDAREDVPETHGAAARAAHRAIRR